MNKFMTLIITLFLLSGCVKERFVGKYVSTTFPVIEFTENNGAGSLSLISNKGNTTGGFNIVASLNKLHNNRYILHADVTPTLNMEKFLETSFYLILLDSGQIVRSIRVPSTVNVSSNDIIINKDFENNVPFDSFTFFYQTKFIY